ncbi:MAG TPA: hypothetical protein PKJ78_17240 [Candidatus Hydrogenedentes bacterium]|nr:hypothetical protein [Candidatus Hydrogenedentota bacterium]
MFTSEQPTLLLAPEILEEARDRIVSLYPDEVTDWLEDHPDPDIIRTPITPRTSTYG